MYHIEDYFKVNSGRIFILGNGRSLKTHDLSLLNPDETMTINRAWRDVPGALYHVCSGDLTGIRKEPQHVLFLGQESQYPKVPLSCPVVLVETKIAGTKRRKFKKQLDVPGALDLRLGWPPTHAGLFAVFAAAWLGFSEVYLLGYDGYGGHYTQQDWDLIIPEKKVQDEFRKHMEVFGKYSDVRVFNCNPRNAYNNLPLASYEDLW